MEKINQKSLFNRSISYQSYSRKESVSSSKTSDISSETTRCCKSQELDNLYETT